MTILLFDVDGTLTPSGDIIQPDMTQLLSLLSQKNEIKLGIVGGGNYEKIKWQMQDSLKYFKYVFAECGAVIYVDGKLVSEKNMLDYCDRKVLNDIVKKALNEISQMPIIYHGNQIDFRKGLVYISPPGMQATNFERNIFIDLDTKFNLRKNLLNKLNFINSDSQFEITLGGAVGIAVYPKGWNKSQVLQYFSENNIKDKMYYFGDRCEPDGNDYPIYSHSLVHGIAVKDYKDTIIKLNGLFDE
ncbi:phosphomannomutase [Tupanvirus soda lake]|uniref:phosphomannomutase n=2 Tax=Tupanvirus TaxID=2094720 RepID=A0A6N1NXN1_9VIRU|nr:phosphomannomutase [Tupanvirus soda lake]QKU34932.1 phosphomannomutase [Tupanvirus soda lake]